MLERTHWIETLEFYSLFVSFEIDSLFRKIFKLNYILKKKPYLPFKFIVKYNVKFKSSNNKRVYAESLKYIFYLTAEYFGLVSIAFIREKKIQFDENFFPKDL